MDETKIMLSTSEFEKYVIASNDVDQFDKEWYESWRKYVQHGRTINESTLIAIRIGHYGGYLQGFLAGLKSANEKLLEH